MGFGKWIKQRFSKPHKPSNVKFARKWAVGAGAAVGVALIPGALPALAHGGAAVAGAAGRGALAVGRGVGGLFGSLGRLGALKGDVASQAGMETAPEDQLPIPGSDTLPNLTELGSVRAPQMLPEDMPMGPPEPAGVGGAAAPLLSGKTMLFAGAAVLVIVLLARRK